MRTPISCAISAALFVASPGLKFYEVFAADLAPAASRGTPVPNVVVASVLAGSFDTYLSNPGANLLDVLPSENLAKAELLMEALSRGVERDAARDAVAAAAPAGSSDETLRVLNDVLSLTDESDLRRRGGVDAAVREIARQLSLGPRHDGPGGSGAPSDLAASLESVRSAIQATSAGRPAWRPVFDGGSAAAERPAADDPVPINSSFLYKAHGLLLRSIAAVTGAVHSLRPAGLSLTGRRLREAADRRAVLADVDETLEDSTAEFDHRLSPQTVQAVEAVHSASKTIDLISDRPETVLDTLSTLPPEERAGMYVGVEKGAKIYRYNEQGQPHLVYVEPPMSETVRGQLSAGAESLKARLGEVGAVQDSSGPSETWKSHSYTMRFRLGSTWEQVLGAARILQEELVRAGSDLKVQAREAKDPTKNVPYITVSTITKVKGAKKIAELRGLSAEDFVVVGDGMYRPRAPERGSRLARLGARVSGRAMPEQGNSGDAEMARGLPGALAFGVGGTGDPTVKNLTVLAGKGPAVTRNVLFAVASKPADAPRASRWDAFLRRLSTFMIWWRAAMRYFIGNNVADWRVYRRLRDAAVDNQGRIAVSNARNFFVDLRMLGQIGGNRTLTQVWGSFNYVAAEAAQFFDRHFGTAGAWARAAFLDYIEREILSNPHRSASNLRKKIGGALLGASLLLPAQVGGFFLDLRAEGSVSRSLAQFQAEQQPAVVAAFRRAVEETLREEAPGPERLTAVVLFGSFARGAATPESDLDFHLVSSNGSTDRLPAFLDRLRRRWERQPDPIRGFPLGPSPYCFFPDRATLLRVHNRPYLVLSTDVNVERTLSPPARWYETREPLEETTLRERVGWRISNVCLRLAAMLADAKDALRGRLVPALDSRTRTAASAGWIVARTLYLAGFVLAGVIAYPLFAQDVVGRQGYIDLMALGAIGGKLLAPFGGILADRLSLRNTYAINNFVRFGLALGLAVLAWLGVAGFWPLLLLSFLASWNVTSALIAEDKLLPALAGGDPQKLSVFNAVANINFIGLNVLIGIFLVGGHWIDQLVEQLGSVAGYSAVFAINAALAGAGFLIQLFTIPNVRLERPQAAPAAPVAPKPASAESQKKRPLLWGLLLALGAALYVLLHDRAPHLATLPLTAAIGAMTVASAGFKRLWANSVLRAGALLSMLYGFVVFPVGAILIPFMAKELDGGGLLQGQLQGALFFGQLLAASTLLNLPGWLTPLIRAAMLVAFGVWLAFYLFPASLLLAAAGMAVMLALYALASRLTDRGWMRYAFIGLAAIAAPILAWGNIPILLLSILIVGLVNAPNKIAIDTIVQHEARNDPDHSGLMLGVRAALVSIAASFGYAVFGAIPGAFDKPEFPAALWPVLALFAVVGALFWLTPRLLAGRLSSSNFKGASAALPKGLSPERLAELRARRLSAAEIAELLADRVRNGGIKVVITDYDGSLEDKTPDNKAVPASDGLVRVFGALGRQDVYLVVSSNHFFIGDNGRGNDNDMDHLLGRRLDPPTRARAMFVGQSGSRIDEYGPDGAIPSEPLWKETPFDDAERARITPTFEAAAAALGLQPGDYRIYHEDSRSLIELRKYDPTDDGDVRRAQALYEALARANGDAGWGYLTQLKAYPTMRDGQVPYVQYIKAHKGTGARRAFEILKARGVVQDDSQVLILGDDFVENDIKMARALPRALAFSLGERNGELPPNAFESELRNAAGGQAVLGELSTLLNGQR